MSTKSVYSAEYKTVLSRLKKARLSAKLNQIEVARRLGKPQSFISKVEVGERRLDIIELKKLAAIYKRPVSFFIGSK